jgi:predicted DNA-binding transcriptional regulator AlpA
LEVAVADIPTYQDTWLRYDDLVQRGIVANRTTLRRWIKAGILPPPTRLGLRTIAWPKSVIEAFEKSRPRASSENAA